MKILRSIVTFAFVVAAAGAALAAPTEIDMTVAGTVDSTTLTDAVVQSFDNTSSVGTGSIYSFLRIEANGTIETEQGYNTDARASGNPKVQFDQKTDPNFTRSITLGQIPIVTINGVEYREFLLDVNEPNNTTHLITLYELAFYIESVGDLDMWPTDFSSPIWSMNDPIQAATSTSGADDFNILIDSDNTQGSGNRFDLVVYVKSSLFGGDNDKYVYLYSRFGRPVAVNAGFEEWAVREAVNGVVVVPEPGSLALLGLGAMGLVLLRRRKRA